MRHHGTAQRQPTGWLNCWAPPGQRRRDNVYTVCGAATSPRVVPLKKRRAALRVVAQRRSMAFMPRRYFTPLLDRCHVYAKIYTKACRLRRADAT